MRQNIHFGLVLPESLTRDTWETFGLTVLRPVVKHLEIHDAKIAEALGDLDEVRSRLAWAIGDWLLAGIKRGYAKPGRLRKYAKKYLGLDRSLGTFSNYMTVCKVFDFSRRRERLKFSHHQKIAKFHDEKDQEELLDTAEGYMRGADGNKIPLFVNSNENPQPIPIRRLLAIIATAQETGRLPRTGKGKDNEPTKTLNLKVSEQFDRYLRNQAHMRFYSRNPGRMVWWMVEQYLREHKADLDAEYEVFCKQTTEERDAHWNKVSAWRRQQYRREHPGEFVKVSLES